jgi:hypothetical protein
MKDVDDLVVSWYQDKQSLGASECWRQILPKAWMFACVFHLILSDTPPATLSSPTVGVVLQDNPQSDTALRRPYGII